MSIIHEALKKAQSTRYENSVTVSQPVPGKKTFFKHSAHNIILLSGIVLLLTGLAFYYIDAYYRQIKYMPATKSDIPALLAANVSTLTGPAATVSPRPSLPQPKKGEIILSGIIKMDGKSFALINNEFYETGETVQGVQITQITPDSIDILQKGKIKTLKVLRPN